MTFQKNSTTWLHLSSDDPLFGESCLAFLEDLYQRYLDVTEGENSHYIRELAQVNPNFLGIAILTTQVKIYSVGDASRLFTIQSILIKKVRHIS